MNVQKFLDIAKNNGWAGIDTSIYVSLFEYGLLWIYRPKSKDYLCIIGTHFDDESQEFNMFSIDWFDENAFDDFSDHIKNAGFIQSMDIRSNEWDNKDIHDVPYMIFEIISYYGWQEIVEYDSGYNVEQTLAYISDDKWGKQIAK